MFGSFNNAGRLTVNAGNGLILAGATTLGGIVDGAGGLVLGFGTTAITTQAITVAALGINGGNGGATATLATDLGYGGTFAFLGQFDTLNLGGHTLTLTGAATLSNAITGGGTLKANGASTIGFASIGTAGASGAAATTLEIGGTVLQDNVVNVAGTVVIDQGATWRLRSATSISANSTAASGVYVNNGTFVDDSGGGISRVYGSFTNAGRLTVNANDTLSFTGANTLGGTIDGAGTLLLSSGTTTLTSSAITVGTLAINGGQGDAGHGPHLCRQLRDPEPVRHADPGWADADAHGAGDPGQHHHRGRDRQGDRRGNRRVPDAGRSGGKPPARRSRMPARSCRRSSSRWRGSLRIDQGATYTITAASDIVDAGGGTVVNNGMLIGNAAGTSDISAAIVNNGVITAQAGTLRLRGAVSGSGQLQVGAGATLVVSAANAKGATVAFLADTGTLSVSTAFNATGQQLNVTGFGLGDTIDFTGTTSVSLAGNLVNVATSAGTATYSIQPRQLNEGFTLASDGNGGMLLTARIDDGYPLFTRAVAGAGGFTDQPGDQRYAGNGTIPLTVAEGRRGATIGKAPNGDLTLNHGNQIELLSGVPVLQFIDGQMVFDPNTVPAAVVRMYQAALGRLPDQGGLQFWVGQLNAGVPLANLATGFLSSGEFTARYGTGLSNAAFVTQIYQNVLGRAPDAGGLAFFTGRLDAHTASLGQTLADIAESAENKAVTASLVSAGIWVADPVAGQVARLYDTAFGRLPDAGGLAFWTTSIKSGGQLLDEAQAFVGSPEFVAQYGALNNADFVNALYVNTLHRGADAAGSAYWVGVLNGGTSRGSVVDVVLGKRGAPVEHGGEHPEQRSRIIWDQAGLSSRRLPRAERARIRRGEGPRSGPASGDPAGGRPRRSGPGRGGRWRSRSLRHRRCPDGPTAGPGPARRGTRAGTGRRGTHPADTGPRCTAGCPRCR